MNNGNAATSQSIKMQQRQNKGARMVQIGVINQFNYYYVNETQTRLNQVYYVKLIAPPRTNHRHFRCRRRRLEQMQLLSPFMTFGKEITYVTVYAYISIPLLGPHPGRWSPYQVLC
ncbi:unnamed protein product [Fructobacillus evanidus]|uniref:Uncharacterized protein n=1 Tax=Fructobacillus evanidus TaxID=3064281 RepID=A0ABM9MUA7_9LACO|nr:unnamed protein product [Fructobacillus sp. LMG 32999]CAK1238293.1 unnamed protein product [Fructobacillus sp. LMG 32999]CAK1240539.1 unnamed protein product [Fructobacillus sp. LMG 32999]CAK1244148.1 unnamed protein product [Fructobacillus sp. LMG 32999]CAK1244488.1 unnamed protein product [Fructobacillus sp. LMG 32999]